MLTVPMPKGPEDEMIEGSSDLYLVRVDAFDVAKGHRRVIMSDKCCYLVDPDTSFVHLGDAGSSERVWTHMPAGAFPPIARTSFSELNTSF